MVHSEQKKENPGIARNPKTNETINVPAHYVPYFKPGKELKEMVTKKPIKN